MTYQINPRNTGLTTNIFSGWNATYSPAGGQVNTRNMSYNPIINPNTAVGIGFQAQ